MVTDIEAYARRRVVTNATNGLKGNLISTTCNIEQVCFLVQRRIEQETLGAVGRNGVVESPAKHGSHMNVKTLATQEVNGQIPFEEYRNLNVICEQFDSKTLILVIINRDVWILVIIETLDHFFELTHTHASVKELGLNGKMLANVPAAEHTPLTHTSLKIIGIAVERGEVYTSFEAPMETILHFLGLRHCLDRHCENKRQCYQRFVETREQRT